MFRVTLLSVVLTLLVGPHATLLCKAWCDPADAARAGCHHDGATRSPRVSGSDNCGIVVLSNAILVRDDAGRGLSDPNAPHAVVGPRDRFPASANEIRFGREPGREWSLPQRPVVTALRI